MHELGQLLAEARAEEIERKARRYAERARVPDGGERLRFWRRVR